MAGGTLGTVAKGVARLFGEGTVSGLDDRQLLERFVDGGDAVAFESLVARHGPMVLSVCRRTIRDDHSADDAFQATFLLLVRKARTIRAAESLGPWLHRVALRVAARTNRGLAKRRARELSSPAVLARASTPEPPDRELIRALHEAVDSLPEKYRAPIVMCYLEGRTHDEAAISLRWPIGSVKGRLARAREVLKVRLARRGVLAPAGAILAGLSAEARASVPSILHEATIEAAIRFAAGEATASLAAGFSSAGAAVLAEEVSRAMTIKKLTTLAAILLGLIGGGAAAFARQDGKNATTPEASKGGGAQKAERRQPIQAPAPVTPTVEKGQNSGGPSGARVAQMKQDEASQLSNMRVGLLAAVDDIEMEIEVLRDDLRASLKTSRALEATFDAPDFKVGDDGAKGIAINERRLQYLKRRVDETRQKLSELNQQLHHKQTQAERATVQIESLLAEADEAALRPGKPNTAQVGDVVSVEVLEALPGRPITGERLVRPDGTISLTFYGDLPVVGLTRAEIKVKVIEHMQKFITDESLGLVAGRDGAEKGKPMRVPPADSDRVAVDIHPNSPGRAGIADDDLERRIEKVLADREAKNGARRAPARVRQPVIRAR